MQREDKNLLSPAEAAEYLGVTECWLEYTRLRQIGPSFLRLGHRTIRYAVADLEAFIAASRQVPA
jgi:hypothetical protein